MDITKLVYDKGANVWFVPGSEYKDEIKQQYNDYRPTDVSHQFICNSKHPSSIVLICFYVIKVLYSLLENSDLAIKIT